MPRHQSHLVHNRNKRLKCARAQQSPPIRLQHSGEVDLYDGSGRLKVVPVRDFDFHVPISQGEGKYSYEDAANPVNQLGALAEQCVPLVTSNDFASFMAAFNKRSNYEQGSVSDETRTIHKEARDLFSTLPRMFDEWEENDLDRERWLAKFDPAKRERMKAAFFESAWASTEYIGTKDLSVKQEVLIKRDDPEWAPRVIYAGNDVFNAITGPAAMVCMERLVALAETQSFGPVRFKYAYKTNDVELASFIKDDRYPCVVEGDYSRNDREQIDEVAKDIDAGLEVLGLPRWYRTLLFSLERYKVQNKRFGFSARLQFQLPTGTTNTTFRNSLYNTIMFWYTCKVQGRRGKALVLGDDLLAALNKRLDLKGWVATVATFRMVLRAKAPALNGEATFLSRRLVTDCDTPFMLPLIGKALVRFNVRGTANEQVSDSQYMAGKALSYAYEFRHVPFLRVYFLQRHEAEKASCGAQSETLLGADYLNWFAKISGIEPRHMVKAITDETVLIDDDSFEVWLIETYDCDYRQLRGLMEQLILNPTVETLDLPDLEWFRKDYE